MFKGLRRGLIWAAVYTIALQTAFAGLLALPPDAAQTFDPAAIICHSGSAAQDEAPPAQPVSHTQCCDHCVPCTSSPVAVPPEQPALHQLPPPRGERLPDTVTDVPPSSPAASPHLARGPPTDA